MHNIEGAMRIDPHSASELIRASAILLLRIVHSQPDAWTQDARSEVRTVQLQVAVDEVLKGEVSAREASFRIEQRRADAVMDHLGLWFGVPLEPGQRILAFSSSASHDPAELLREGPCTQLLLDPVSIAEARLAVGLELRDPPLGEVFGEAWEQRAGRGSLFVRWLWDRAEPEAWRSPAAFGQVARLIADEQVEERARETLANLAYERLLEAPGPVERQRALLVRALLKALGVPKASSFHPNAEGVLLRNLLSLDKGPGRPTAGEVFRGHGQERTAAAAVLRARPPSPARDRLLRWIEPEPPR